MVEFGRRLHDACAQHGVAWTGHCIAYDDLKLVIENEKQSSSVSVAADTEASQQEFRYALDREIEKAVLFVLQEQGSIAAELERLAERRAIVIQKHLTITTLQLMRGNDHHLFPAQLLRQ